NWSVYIDLIMRISSATFASRGKRLDISCPDLPYLLNLCGVPSSKYGKSRSEEHTSELQSRGHHVCRLLLQKKKSTPVTISGTACTIRVLRLLRSSVLGVTALSDTIARVSSARLPPPESFSTAAGSPPQDLR